MDSGESTQWRRQRSCLHPYYLRAWFDGGRRSEELSSCGWVLKACFDRGRRSWVTVAKASVLLPPGTTTVDAELTGAELATAALGDFAAESFGRTARLHSAQAHVA